MRALVKERNAWLDRRGVVAVCAIFGLALLVIFKASDYVERPERHSTENEFVQVINSPLVTVMGSDALNKAYNLFRGKGASASIANEVVAFTVKQDNTVDWGDTVYLQPDQVEITMNARCYSHLSSETAFGLYSSSQAESLAREAAGGMAVSVNGKFGPAKGGLDASAAFGNKASMKSAQNAMKENFGSMSRAYVQATLYDTVVDWADTTIVVKPAFRTRILELNDGAKKLMVAKDSCAPMEHPCCHYSQCPCCPNTPSCCPAPAPPPPPPPPPDPKALFLKSLQFFERFGTHVIKRGAYGAKCSMSTFMSKYASAREVSRELQQQKESQFAVKAMAEYNGFFSSGSVSFSANGQSSSQSGSVGASRVESKTDTTVSDVICSGYVEDNVCNQQFDAKADNPAMVSYELLPIWEIPVAFKSYGHASEHLKETYNEISGLLDDCKRENHKGCFFDERFWDRIRDWGSDALPDSWHDETKKYFLKLENGAPVYAEASHYTWIASHSKPCNAVCKSQGKVAASVDDEKKKICSVTTGGDNKATYPGVMTTWHIISSIYMQICSPEVQEWELSGSINHCLCLNPGTTLFKVESQGYPCSWTCAETHDRAILLPVSSGAEELCLPEQTIAGGVSRVLNSDPSRSGPGNFYRCIKKNGSQMSPFQCLCVT